MPAETDLYEPLCTALERELDDDYECRHDHHLIYDLRYESADGVNQQSYETDVVVYEDDVPRVVVEVKLNGVTTHDLVVYDRKARDHKRTRPYLRYGMAAFGMDGGITKRYVWHTDALDFFFLSEGVPGPADTREDDATRADGWDRLSEAELSRLVHLVRRNLRASHELERVLDGYSNHVTMNRAVQFSLPARSREPADAPYRHGSDPAG